MSEDLRRCALIAGSLASTISLEITYNDSILESKDTVFDFISTLIVKSEPHLNTKLSEPDGPAMFDTYIEDLSNIIYSTVGDISNRYNKDIMLPMSRATLKNELSNYVVNKLASVNTIKSDTNLEDVNLEPKSIVVDNGIDSSEEYGNESTDRSDSPMSFDEFFTKTGENRQKIKKGELTVYELYDLYFSDMPELASKFRTQFIQTFYNKLIDLDPNGFGYNEDINDVLESTRELFKGMISSESTQDFTSEDILLTSKATDQFFAKVIVDEFDSVVKMFLPGIKFVDDTNSYDLSEGSAVRRTFASYDGSFSGFDQITDVMKMHIYTTPRLVLNPSGEWVQDTDRPYITEYELKSVVDILNKYPADLNGFKYSLQSELDSMSDTYPAKSILMSINDKFFKDSDSKSKSFYSFLEDGYLSENDPNFMLQNVLTALLVDLRSKQNMEHIIVNNGKTIITKTQNRNVQFDMIKQFESTISDDKNKSVINNRFSKKIIVLTPEEGSNITKIKVLTGKTSGIIIDLVKGEPDSGRPVYTTTEDLEDISTANSVLQSIGFPPYLSGKFLRDYKARNEDKKLSLSNFVANMVYMVAMNDDTKVTEMGDLVANLEESKDPDTLKYQIFQGAYGFLDPVIVSAIEVEGGGANKMRINGDGNIVAVTGVRSRLYDTPNLINRIADNYPDSLHYNNVFVKGLDGTGHNYTLDGFYAKDGIKIRGNRKSNSRMTILEQHKYLIEDTFLKMAATNGYTSTLIQPAVYSDRSVIDLAMVSSVSSEFMPVTSDGRLDETTLYNELRNTHLNHQRGLEKVIIDEWSKYIQNLVDTKVIESMPDISTIKKLNDFINKSKFKLSDISKSELVKNLMYTGYKTGEGTFVKIKESFMVMSDILSNDSKSKEFFNRQMFKFVNDLSIEGFNISKLSFDSKEMLKERFHGLNDDNAFKALIKSYFYHSNTISFSIMNLNQGSLYQFKGDIDYREAANNPSWESIRETLLRQNISSAKVYILIEEAINNLAIDTAFNSMFVDQTKRNAGLGSGFQHPRLADIDINGLIEKGKLLDRYSKTAVIEDPKEMMSILGDVSNYLGQEVYDASMFGHPLYFLKLNHSLGNNMSGFTNQGGAIKDISNELDPVTGVNRFQKKATFNVFSNEILRMATPALERLFSKMNKSIKFPKGTKGPKGETIKDMNDLWQLFGGKRIDNSWELVLEFLSENPEIRNSYIQKVGFTSGEKSGSRSINTKDVWEGNEPLKYTDFDNRYHGIILNSHHDYDTNAGDVEGKHDNEVSLITQIISAAAFEGNTMDISLAINSAIQSLTESNLAIIEEEIGEKAVNILKSLIKNPESDIYNNREDLKLAKSLVYSPALSIEESSKLEDLMNKYDITRQAKLEFSKELTIKSIETREAFSDTLSMLNSESSTLDSAQVQSSMHSAILSEINKRTVKLKFKGGQYVVSAVHDFVKLYTLPNGISVTRDVYMESDLVPEDKLSIEDFKSLMQSDIVKVNGVATLVSDVKQEDLKAGKVVGKKIGDGRKLDWVQYRSNTGITNSKGEVIYSIKDTDQYKELLKNSDDIKNSKSDDEKLELEKHRTSLKISLRKVLEDTTFEWTGQHAEFYMPMIHQQRYNLENGMSLSKIMGTYDETTDKGKELGKQHRVKFFSGLIKANPDKYNLNIYSDLTEENYELELEKLKGILGYEVPGTIQYLTVKSMIDYMSSVTDSDITTKLSSVNNNRKSQLDLLVKSIATDQAVNFPRTLEFITARIPAQGKQSYMAGKIQGFINSNQNAIYGPAEMLTVTGADHDIDKANIMAFSVDKNGVIYDYTPYLVGNDISSDKFKEQLEAKKKAYIESAKNLGLNPVKIKENVSKLVKEETNRFIESTKNFLLDKLMDSVLDPLNAVEAATPMSMDTLKSKVDKVVKMGIVNGKIIPIESSFVTPTNPASIPVLESINSIGKEMIGIFASGLKANAAVFTSVMSDPYNTEVNKFNGDMSSIYNQSEDFRKVLNSIYGEEFFANINNAIYIVNKGKNPKESTIVANTGRFTKTKAESEAKYREAFDAFNSEYIISQGNKYNYSKMLKAFDEKTLNDLDRILLDETLSETQSWGQISELLSAATDNAKELILGKIGANNMTGGMMTAGLVLGFDLETVLELFSNPRVKQFFKNIESSRDTTNNSRYLDISTELDSHFEFILNGDKSVENVSLEKSLSKINKSIEQEEDLLSKVDIESYEDTKKLLNINSIEDVNITSITGHKESLGEFKGVSSGEVRSTPVTNDFIYEVINPFLKEMGIDISDVKKPQMLYNMLKLVSDSNIVIIPNNLGADYNGAVRSFAKYKNIPVYSVNDKGEWTVTTATAEFKTLEPLLGKNTVYLTGEQLITSQKEAISKIVDSTKEFLDNPSSYDKRIESIKEISSKKINLLKESRDKLVTNFVTDPLRQLRTLNKVAEELKSINSMILNQGLPNSDWEVQKFFAGIVDKLPTVSSVKQFKDFISSYSSISTGKPLLPGMLNDGGLLANDMLKTADFHKVAFNPLRVITNNKHYLSYIKSIITAENIVRSSGFINESIDHIINDYINNKGDNPILDNIKYNQVKSFVYGITIETFFDKNNSVATIDGIEYKLKYAEGRTNFMEKAVSLVEKLQTNSELEDNPFIKKLRIETIKDFIYYNDSKVISLNNMFSMEPHELAVIKLGLNKLKEIDPESHNALYNYSLILNKGGRGQSSFSSLFDVKMDAYKNYLESLSSTDFESFKSQLKEVTIESILLANPDTIRLKSTQAKKFRSSSEDGSREDSKYVIPSFKKSNPVFIFKSRDNNKIYIYNTTLKKYVVVSPKYNNKFMPFSIKGNLTDMLGTAGYQYGETANISNGETVQVLSYVDNKGYNVMYNDGSYGFLTGSELQPYNDDMVFRQYRFGKITKDEKSNEKFNPLQERKVAKTEDKVVYKDPSQDQPFENNILGFEPGDAVPNDWTTEGINQSSQPIKEGVSELFESNSDLANEVYEALGFGQESDLSKKEQLQKIAKLNKGKIVSVNYDKYKTPFKATITGKIVEVSSPTKLIYDDGRVEYKDDGVYHLQIKSSTGKILTANTFEITGLSELVITEITPQQKQQAQQLYSQYLDTIFPDSKVKDIVYHGTNKEKFESVDITKSKWGGKSFYVTTDRSYAKSYATNKGNIISILINSKNIKRKADAYAAQPYNKENLQKELNDINSDKIKLSYIGERGLEIIFVNTEKEAKDFIQGNSGWEIASTEDLQEYSNKLKEELTETPYDTILTNVEGGGDIILAVFKPEQIHILSSNSDIQGFKEFVGKPKTNQQVNEILNLPKEELTKWLIDKGVINVPTDLMAERPDLGLSPSELQSAIDRIKSGNIKYGKSLYVEVSTLYDAVESLKIRDDFPMMRGKGNSTDRGFSPKFSDIILDAINIADTKKNDINSISKIPTTLEQRDELSDMPKDLGFKSAEKASVSNKFIGYTDPNIIGITTKLSRGVESQTNVGTYNEDDVVFMSIPGNRGLSKDGPFGKKPSDSDKRWIYNFERTKDEVLSALRSGATVITDPVSYTNTSNYNTGEKAIAEELTKLYEEGTLDYKEEIVDGETIGVWRPIEPGNIVPFHKGPVTYTDNLGKKLSSKKVSSKVIESVFNRVNSLIGGRGKLMTAETIKQVYGARYADKAGFVINNQVIINSDVATLDTPIHEIGGHIYLRHLKITDPEAYSRLTQKAFEHPMSEYIMRTYPELKTKEDIGEEVFSTLLGLESQGKLSQDSMSFLEKLKSISKESTSIMDFINKLLQTIFGVNTKFKVEPGDSLMNVIASLNNNIIFGDGSALKNLSYDTKSILEKAINPIKTESDIEERLRSLGLITKICR